jgi:hypothetical protein
MIDAAEGLVFFGTGNPDPNNPTCGGSQNYSSSVVALNAGNLSYVDSWQLPPEQLACNGTYDCDFGSTPTSFQEKIDNVPTNMVGIANKDGYYYAFREQDFLTGGPINPAWQYQIGAGEGVLDGSISPSAYDSTLNPNGNGSLGTLYIAGGKPLSSNLGDPCYPYTASVGSRQAFDMNVNITTTNPSPSPNDEWAVCFDNTEHNPSGGILR